MNKSTCTLEKMINERRTKFNIIKLTHLFLGGYTSSPLHPRRGDRVHFDARFLPVADPFPSRLTPRTFQRDASTTALIRNQNLGTFQRRPPASFLLFRLTLGRKPAGEKRVNDGKPILEVWEIKARDI